jgi:predicted RNA binding protein YcfA (HicA-like mRNA interferase family)
MPSLRVLRGDDLVRALEKAGFAVSRIRGSHHRLVHPDGRHTTVPVHRGCDLPPGTLRSILREAAISPEQLRDLIG